MPIFSISIYGSGSQKETSSELVRELKESTGEVLLDLLVMFYWGFTGEILLVGFYWWGSGSRAEIVLMRLGCHW